MAEAVREVVLTFGSTGDGDGQLELGERSGLVVDETSHDIYVADTENHRVMQFSANGAFIRAFGADVGGPGVDVCTSGCVAGTSESSPGAFEAPTFVAVDNSGGPSAGDVYVGDSGNNLVTKFGPEGSLISTWGSGGQLDGSTATDGPFGPLAGIAVDSAGTLEVYEAKFPSSAGNVLFEFDEDGTFATDFTTPRGTSPDGLAVDSTGNFFKANGDHSVERFDGSGGEARQITETHAAKGLAVDTSNDELFIDRGESIENYAFEPSGEVVGTGCTPTESTGCPPTRGFGSGDLSAGRGLAVDSTSHTVYAADAGTDEVLAFALLTPPDVTTEAATEITPSEATLNGAVNPEGFPLTECFFEYDTAPYASEEAPHGKTAPCDDPDAEEAGEGISFVPVHAKVSGLRAGTTYHFRMVAENVNARAEGEDEEFLTPGPSIRSVSVSQITATGAKVSGEVNPRGEATSFEVQYVTEAQFDETEYEEAASAPIPPQGVGSEAEFVKVAQQLSELAPDTTYHFRLLATNATATNEGEDHAFATFALTTTPLPDDRAYELVSPVQKAGEVFPPFPVSSLSGSCNNCLPGISEQMAPMQSAPDGDAVLYLGQPFTEGLASGANEYLAGRSSASGWATQGLSAPEFANGRGASRQGYQAFSPDLSQGVVYQISPALSDAAPSREGVPFANLYLRASTGDLQPLVSEEPPNREPGFGPESFQAFYAGANAGTTLVPSFSHLAFEANEALTQEVPGIAPAAIDGGPGESSLNLYEWVGGALRLVNVLPDNASTEPGAVIGSGRLLAPKPFAEAADVDHAVSDDGSRIFWSDQGGQAFVRVDGEETREINDPGVFLTASADGSKALLSDGCLYDIEEEICQDLTLDKASVHQGGFQGILGAAEDLSRIYFVDTKALTEEGEANGNGEHAEEGAFNLYAWDEGTTSFIGRLLERDNQIGILKELGDWKPAPSGRTAQVSEDGRSLAFMSRASLTGYDNEAGSGACGATRCYEVFTYDADTEALACVSCNPSGQLPLGPSNLSLIKGSPGFPPLRQPDNLSAAGDGRLFFESQDALSPHDTNGDIQDVYEWEPNGVGGCQRAVGCVFLISSGHSANDSMFLDSSESGNDAFFVTRERLLGRDEDELLDLYDARSPHSPGEAVGFPEGQIAPCASEACKAPISSPPQRRSAGSSAFSGTGNPPRSHKKHKKHHKKKHKRHKRSEHRKRGGAR